MKKLSFLLMFISFVGIGQTKSKQNSPALSTATPSSLGFSPERIARIDAMIQEAVDNKVIPGAVIMVCRNGKIAHQKAFGQKDAENKLAFETDDIFRIASQSKAITTTAAMMLWEEGKFRLDDPISKFIPEFKNPVVLDRFFMKDSSYTTKPAGKEITVRQLMTHTSGLGYGVIDGDERFKAIYKKAGITDLFTTEPISIGESVKKLAKLPLHFVPGESYQYSEGLDVLGYLIEIWSGQTFDDFLQKRVFAPMVMKADFFYLPQVKADRLVPVQTKDDNGNWIHFTDTFYDVDYPKTGARTFYSGGAGLSSTAYDYATFLQMYLNKGELNGNRLLSRNTVDFMLQNQVGNLFGEEKGFGLGFSILTKNGEMKGGKGSEGAFDWGGYFNTQYFADPKDQVIGIIMKQTQRVGGDYTSDMFRQLVFQAIDD
jgi:CubicO group peptidase (beta-lactamase class C family)